ncbi:hypothetical protein PIB30_078665 [Stylosanthes scabra]|uniref:Uncharacterized protein n=1 Tax=Stylosanthes scabra TaxID=79078 RepID=A0ABU6XRV0_9FABA|nr:hypothetical protein [Stylosanthes scabra]
MVAEEVGRLGNLFFKSEERRHEIEEGFDVVAECSGGSDGVAGIGEGVEAEDLWAAPSLLTSFHLLISVCEFDVMVKLEMALEKRVKKKEKEKGEGGGGGH